MHDVVKVAVLYGRNDLLKKPLRLLRRWPSLRHDVIEQLPVRCVLLLNIIISDVGHGVSIKEAGEGGGLFSTLARYSLTYDICFWFTIIC